MYLVNDFLLNALFLESLSFELDTTNDTIIYDADINALDDISFGQTLAEAKQFGPIVTPKQYQCSYCVVGACSIVITGIQCNCGSNQCQPSTTSRIVYFVSRR